MNFLENVATLAEKGVDPIAPSTFGLHGTSIQAIKYLAKHGRMPASPIYMNEFHIVSKTGKYPRGPYVESQNYARLHTFRNTLILAMRNRMREVDPHLIRQVLGLEDDCYERGIFPGPGEPEIQKKIMKTLNIDSEYHFGQFLVQMLQEKHGVVLSLCPEILELQHRKGVGDDIVVTDPDGVPLNMINGIEPQGQFEWKELIENKMLGVQSAY